MTDRPIFKDCTFRGDVEAIRGIDLKCDTRIDANGQEMPREEYDIWEFKVALDRYRRYGRVKASALYWLSRVLKV